MITCSLYNYEIQQLLNQLLAKLNAKQKMHAAHNIKIIASTDSYYAVQELLQKCLKQFTAVYKFNHLLNTKSFELNSHNQKSHIHYTRRCYGSNSSEKTSRELWWKHKHTLSFALTPHNQNSRMHYTHRFYGLNSLEKASSNHKPYVGICQNMYNYIKMKNPCNQHINSQTIFMSTIKLYHWNIYLCQYGDICKFLHLIQKHKTPKIKLY